MDPMKCVADHGIVACGKSYLTFKGLKRHCEECFTVSKQINKLVYNFIINSIALQAAPDHVEATRSSPITKLITKDSAIDIENAITKAKDHVCILFCLLKHRI